MSLNEHFVTVLPYLNAMSQARDTIPRHIILNMGAGLFVISVMNAEWQTLLIS